MRFTVTTAMMRAALAAARGRPSGHRRGLATSKSLGAQYGFVGLGNMGFPMAKNLWASLTPSDSIRVFDLNLDGPRRLVKEVEEDQSGEMGGAGVTTAMVEVVDNAFDVAKDADAIITVLPAAEHVKLTVTAMLTAALPPNPDRLFIDCSTIDPVTSRALARAIAPQHGTFVDAPMSGGVYGATLGSLTFMLGCPERTVSRVTPILERMGKQILHCGPNGSGLAAKLVNNYVLSISNLAVAEAMNLGVRLGVDPKTLTDVMSVSTAKCWCSDVNNPVPGVVNTAPAGRDYEGGFSVGLMSKDLELVNEAAEEARATLPLLEKVRALYLEMERQGLDKKDFSVIYRHIGGPENPKKG